MSYHIKKDGTPGICRAKPGNCPYGDFSKHFPTREEAQLYADKKNDKQNESNKKLNNILSKLRKSGAKTFYVGGYVRDELLGKENKDIDIEIHNISEDNFINIFKSQNIKLDYVGKSFGVFKASLDGEDFDFSFPRTEVQTGDKHTDFEISVDPFIGTEKAAERRDFTINALMKDTETGEIIDYYNGIKDLKNKTIRHCSDKFSEDALRVFRAAQFSSRFDFKIAEETINLSQNIDCSNLPKERVFEETNKAILKSNKPSIYFKNLKKLKVLDLYFPELSKQKLSNIDKISKFAKELYPNDTSNIILAEIYKNKEVIISNQIDLRELKKTFEILDKSSNDYINSSNKESLGNLIYESETVKNDKNPILTIFTNSIKNKKTIQETKILIKDFEETRNEIRKEYINGNDLMKLGFKPSKEFSEIINKSKLFASKGGKKKEFIKTIIKEKE
jgi:hypothetical protein